MQHRHLHVPSTGRNSMDFEPIFANLPLSATTNTPFREGRCHESQNQVSKTNPNVAYNYGATAPVIMTATNAINQHSPNYRVQEARVCSSPMKCYIWFAGLFIFCIVIMNIVSFILVWILFFVYFQFSTFISYTIMIGTSFIILACVALPACICLSKYSQTDSESRSCCSVKFVLYVSVFLAFSFAFVGTSITGVLQVVSTTQCATENEAGITDSELVASSNSVISLLSAILCFFVATITICTCYKDRSRKCSNFCVKMFILQVLLYLTSTIAIVVTSYSLFFNIIYANFSFSDMNKYQFDITAAVIAPSIGGGVLGILILFLMPCGPLLCSLEAQGDRQLFTKTSGIYMMGSSILVMAEKFVAAVIMITLVSHMSTIDTQYSTDLYYDCWSWHKTPSIAMALFSAFLNIGVVYLGLVSFVFGCYALCFPNAQLLQQESNN